jgi:hypothetical protein
MPCENYREALSEAAATGCALSPDLRSHVEHCADCHAYLNDEIQLCAAVDGGLKSKMAAGVPASLLPRVRARISQEPVSAWRWTPAWTALVASAALVIAFLLLRGPGHRGGQQRVDRTEEARNVAPAQIVPEEPRENTAAPASVARPALKVAEPLVLVPKGQAEIVSRLLEDLRRGQVKGSELIAKADAGSSEIAPIEPLSIAPVEIKPLNADNAEEIR